VAPGVLDGVKVICQNTMMMTITIIMNSAIIPTNRVLVNSYAA
jgi:hypothetical protein